MAVRTRRGIALCAGVGGIELALKLVDPGYKTVCYVEGEAYAAAVLVLRAQEKALDDAPIWSNIKSFDGVPWCGRVDIITAGFPCQPWSSAGKQRGTDDDRWLWPDIARIIKEVEPTEVLLENVPGLLRGGIEVVLEDLAEMGYDAAWGRFSARGVGAPHLRQRIFVLARLADPQCNGQQGEGVHLRRGRPRQAQTVSGGDGEGVADPGESGRGEDEQNVREGQRNAPRENGEGVFMANTKGERGQCAFQQGACSGQPEDEAGNGGGVVGHPELENPNCRDRPPRQRFDGVCSAEDGEELQTFDGGPSKSIFGELGNANSEGLEGRRFHDLSFHTYQLPTWPPGPEDRDAWEELLEEWPEIEPAICGVADGPSPHVDRLRACGNAVVPVVAATAYRHLGEILDGR
jgi:DNA (cytosine-5)-methyltransferase 1